MRLRSQLGYSFGAAAALAMLAGCSGGAGSQSFSAPPGTSAQAVARQGGGARAVVPGTPRVLQSSYSAGVPLYKPSDRIPRNAYAFVAGFASNAVYVLNTSGTIVATLTGNGLSGPAGIAVNPANNKLYVANFNGADVLVYTSLGPPTTLTNGGLSALDVAIDTSGNLAVSDYTAGNIHCFAPGATSPTSTISGGNFSSISFLAFDSSGNLFVDGLNASDATLVGEVVGGCATGTTITDLTTSNTIGFPGDVSVANNGDITIGDQVSSPQDIYSYSPPSGGTLTLVNTTPLNGTADVIQYALTPGSHKVLASDVAGGTADLFPFPTGGTPLKTIDFSGDDPYGVAILPDEEPARH